MLRGNALATVDDKGRLKIPSIFRRHIETAHGSEFFITTIDGAGVHVYPFPVWLEVERKIASFPSFNPSVARLQDLVSYYGSEARMDKQGRLLIQPRLREMAEMSGEVAVLGKNNHLEVWNNERFLARLEANPLTNEDRRVLSGLGL
ncbi:MAG: division/cell wall cluster transcriptional repressor MraZ [Acidobacteriota bacterium]